MSKQLYEEALADVKKLKEIAEDNAKRAILEAVTPRIKDLIENQLLGEIADHDDDDELLFDDMHGVPGKMPDAVDVDPQIASAISLPGEVPLDLGAFSSEDPYLNLSMDDPEAVSALVPEDMSLTVSTESIVNNLEKVVENYAGASAILRETKMYLVGLVSTINKVENTYSALQKQKVSSAKQSLIERLKECHNTLKKLMEQEMNTMKKISLNEAEISLKLKNLPDDVDLEEVEIELVEDESESESESESEGEGEEDSDEEASEMGSEEDSDEEASEMGSEDEGESSSEETATETRWLKGNLVVEIDENMLRNEISRMKSIRESSDMADVQAWGHDAGDVAEDFEDEDHGEPLDLNLSEMDEQDLPEDDMHKKGMKDEPVYEIDEMDEAEDDREHGGNVAPEAAPEAMGAGAKTNKQKQESLVRKINSEIALQTESKKKALRAKSMNKKSVYNYYANQFNESVRRANKLQSILENARQESAPNGGSTRLAEETETLREKLAETNLFNAKLLFTNKLLQNESLTKRQKAEVIERLDEASNVREVKLVYESLVKTLQGGSTGRQISESTNRSVIGSSSRPARPAATTLNEGYEADRWAKLAGIIK
jgi:hypothetical protein